MNPAVTAVKVNKVSDDRLELHDDLLAAEEPLEIVVGFTDLFERKRKSISVTMRTPGNDAELATGFLFTEGIIRSFSDIQSIEVNPSNDNIIRVELSEDTEFNSAQLQRNFYMTSSCGICGKASIESVQALVPEKIETDRSFTSPVIRSLPDKLRSKQAVFRYTGGLHASALFDEEGKLILLREDVGRHNALDKISGAALASEMMPLSQYILLLSGRASFELIQKAAMAGIPVVAAIGAPSGLAVRLAEDTGMTLIGFLRENRFNIYTHSERIILK